MALTNFDIRNFVIDHVLRGTMVSTTDNSVLWSLTQIQSPSLSMSSETVDATDALGTKIMTFERAKEATFSAESAIFDVDLLAAQAGTKKQRSGSDSVIKTPIFDTITLSQADIDAGMVKLSKVPVSIKNGEDAVSSLGEIFKLSGDSSLGKSYAPVTSGTSASADKFYIAADSNELKIPTEMVAGEQIFAIYEYEANDVEGNGAIQVVNSAKNFPTNGKFILEVLGADVCDSTTKVYAYLIFPNCKLSSATDLSFETEMTQGFEIVANQDYCSFDNELWRLVIPEA